MRSRTPRFARRRAASVRLARAGRHPRTIASVASLSDSIARIMSDEKTEAPTHKKLDDAKREGKSPKSTDLAAGALLIGAGAAMSGAAGFMGEHLRNLMHVALDVGRIASPRFDIGAFLIAVSIEAGWVLLPLLGVAIVLPAAALVAQTGFNVSFKSVELKLDAINPAAGIKKLFSLRSLLDLVKMVLKAAILVAVLIKLTMLLLPTTAALAYQSVADVVAVIWILLWRFIAAAGVLFLLIGAADYGLQYWLFIREHRMSKDEVKREFKESEGNPEIKSKRKSIAREIANGPVANVEQANAVVVNPTHYAVAIRYVAEEHGLPRVIAKGVDADALAIRERAEACGVPIVPAPPLARALYTVPLEQAVPEPLFEAVAEVLAWVAQLTPAADAHDQPEVH